MVRINERRDLPVQIAAGVKLVSDFRIRQRDRTENREAGAALPFVEIGVFHVRTVNDWIMKRYDVDADVFERSKQLRTVGIEPTEEEFDSERRIALR